MRKIADKMSFAGKKSFAVTMPNVAVTGANSTTGVRTNDAITSVDPGTLTAIDVTWRQQQVDCA